MFYRLFFMRTLATTPATPYFILPETPAAACLHYLRHHGLTTRNELVTRTGFSQPTVTRAVTALIQAQLVQERPDLIFSSGPGRPRVPVELAPSPRLHVGVSIFAHEYFVGYFDTKGRTVRHRQVPYTLSRTTPDKLWEHISTSIHLTGSSLGLPIANIGISTIGTVDDQGTVTMPLPGWGTINCTEKLLTEFGAPVSVADIATSLAAAELFSAPTGPVPPTLVLVADDTFSAAIIVDGVAAPIKSTQPTTVQALIDAATPVVHEANIQRIILAGASFVRDQDLRSHVGQKLSTSGKDTIELRLIPERELEMRSAARAIALDRCIAHPVAS